MSKLDVVEIWKELHRMPEPGMNEFKTGAYLADALEKLGYEVTRGVGKTGVVGVVRGKEPGPVVMLRADMDALPFKNEDGSIEMSTILLKAEKILVLLNFMMPVMKKKRNRDSNCLIAA